MRFKDRVRYIFYITQELKIMTKYIIQRLFSCFVSFSIFSAFICNLSYLEPKVVEVGPGEAERKLLPAMQFEAK